MVVRAVGVEPTRAVRPCGFSYRPRLSPLAPLRHFSGQATLTSDLALFSAKADLRSGLSLRLTPPILAEVRRRPSSLYTFLKITPVAGKLQAWLGIPSEGFP